VNLIFLYEGLAAILFSNPWCIFERDSILFHYARKFQWIKFPNHLQLSLLIMPPENLLIITS
jgi:hypothetical protein